MVRRDFLSEDQNGPESIGSTGAESGTLVIREDILRVIECPHCSTKFALSPREIHEAQAEFSQDGSAEPDPELHCSSCDAVFALSLNAFYGSDNEYVSAETLEPLHRNLPEDESSEEEEFEEDSSDSELLEADGSALDDEFSE